MYIHIDYNDGSNPYIIYSAWYGSIEKMIKHYNKINKRYNNRLSISATVTVGGDNGYFIRNGGDGDYYVMRDKAYHALSKGYERIGNAVRAMLAMEATK